MSENAAREDRPFRWPARTVVRGVHDLNHAAKQPVFARIFARWIAAEKESVSLVSFRTMPTKFATFSGCRGLRARGTRGGNTVLRAGPEAWCRG